MSSGSSARGPAGRPARGRHTDVPGAARAPQARARHRSRAARRPAHRHLAPLDQGATPTEVARRLGHADATVTLAVYAHEIDNASNRALDRARIETATAFAGVFVETPVET